MSSIIDNIHSTSRSEMTTNAFYGFHKAVLLDFIGAKDYFIIDKIMYEYIKGYYFKIEMTAK